MGNATTNTLSPYKCKKMFSIFLDSNERISIS